MTATLAVALPVGDPQFWVVSGLAAAALVYLVAKRVRFGRGSKPELPCEHCGLADAAKRKASASRRPD